jgi:ABC-type Fe3+ transport system substrate-binding protein
MYDKQPRTVPWMSRRAFLGTFALSGAAAALAACQRSPTSPAPAAAPGDTSATGSQAGWEARWNELIEAAKREGELIVSGAPSPKVRTELPAAFQNRFGIEVEYLGTRTGELMARFEAERAAGQYSVDAIIGGATSLYTVAYPNGWLDSLRPGLVHPEVTDPAKWKVGRVWFMDPDQQYILRLSNQQTLHVSVNTQYVPAEQIRSWHDLLEPKYRGKISVYDPTVSGTGWNTANYLLRTLGEDYIVALYQGQEPGMSRDARQLADWLARGTYPITLGISSTDIEPLRSDGFPIALVLTDTPEMPVVVSAGYGLGTLVNGAPHPNAAKLFLNWMALPEGQEIWNRTMEYVSVRTDVESTWAPDYANPKPGERYFDTYDWEYVLTTRNPEELEKLKRLVGKSS